MLSSAHTFSSGLKFGLLFVITALHDFFFIIYNFFSFLLIVVVIIFNNISVVVPGGLLKVRPVISGEEEEEREREREREMGRESLATQT